MACYILTVGSWNNTERCMQVLLKHDGYVGLQSQELSDSQEAEQLLGSMDSPARVSNTIPELASVSQITAPNTIAAELSAVPLFDQQQPLTDQHAAAQSSPESGSHEYSDNENADPNQLAAQVELQSLGKPKGHFAEHQVATQPSQSRKHLILTASLNASQSHNGLFHIMF